MNTLLGDYSLPIDTAARTVGDITVWVADEYTVGLAFGNRVLREDGLVLLDGKPAGRHCMDLTVTVASGLRSGTLRDRIAQADEAHFERLMRSHGDRKTQFPPWDNVATPLYTPEQLDYYRSLIRDLATSGILRVTQFGHAQLNGATYTPMVSLPPDVSVHLRLPKHPFPQGVKEMRSSLTLILLNTNSSARERLQVRQRVLALLPCMRPVRESEADAAAALIEKQIGVRPSFDFSVGWLTQNRRY